MKITTRDVGPNAGRGPAPWAAGGLIVLAVATTYANTFSGGFVFDDPQSIEDNPTIRSLWPLSAVLQPPPGVTVGGRPILNLSFALNYALGGTSAVGYHIANVAVHILATLLLFGIIRRTLAKRTSVFQARSTAVAFLCALLWGVHPLQTESVSYVVQRAESLMGLFFLASLYAAIRSESGRSRYWCLASIAAAFLCAGTKEIAVALPVIVLLYDRAFLAGSFAGALQKRKALYAGLAVSWLIVAGLSLSAGDRGGTIGTRAGITHWEYALAQSRGLFHYLRLCFWPWPLIMDYGTAFVTWSQALPWAAALLAILAASVFALVKSPPLGFLAAWFFIILAPTSSFVGGTRQMLAEHRLYLSLAAVVIGTVLLSYRTLGRLALPIGLIAAVALSVATFERNRVYHDSLSLYRDTVMHRPGNPWAHNSLGLFLGQSGKTDESLAQYQEALRLKQDYPEAHNNMALLLAGLAGRQSEAMEHYAEALRLNPKFAEAHNNLGNLLAAQPGQTVEAKAQYEAALAIRPDYAEAHYNLANVLAREPAHREEARLHYEAALRAQPDFVEAYNNLGLLLASIPALRNQAAAHYETALRLRPDYAEAHNNLANLLSTDPARKQDAVAHYEAAVRLLPNSFLLHFNLARILETLSKGKDGAILHYEAALKINPDFTPAREGLRRLEANR